MVRTAIKTNNTIWTMLIKRHHVRIIFNSAASSSFKKMGIEKLNRTNKDPISNLDQEYGGKQTDIPVLKQTAVLC